MDNKSNTEEKKSEKLVALNVRMPKDVYDIITEISRVNGVSKAKVCRACLDKRTQEYLEDLVYVEKEQGEQIHRIIYDLNRTLSDIRLEIKRMGVNYNQELRLMNIANKNSGDSTMKKYSMQLADLDDATGSILPTKELEEITERIEKAVKKAGDALCILE